MSSCYGTWYHNSTATCVHWSSGGYGPYLMSESYIYLGWCHKSFRLPYMTWSPWYRNAFYTASRYNESECGNRSRSACIRNNESRWYIAASVYRILRCNGSEYLVWPSWVMAVSLRSLSSGCGSRHHGM